MKILGKASKLYGDSLTRLRDSIENPLTCFDPYNISATISLHLYETIVYTSGLGWIQHAGGAGRLIELRGPERHQDWPDHGYFTLARPRVIFQAIVQRKRTFLEKAEWLTVPWAKHPETKTPHQKLLDIAALIPGLQEDWWAARSIAADDQDMLQLSKRFIPKIARMLENLFRWRWTWEAEHPSAVSELPVDPATSLCTDLDTGKPLFSTVFEFADTTRANEIAMYNSVALMVLHISTICHGGRNPDFIAEQIRKSLLPDGQLPAKTNPLRFPNECFDYSKKAHEWFEYSNIADEIAQTIDYYSREEHFSQGVYSLIFPLRMW